jgi:AcrR family transcriptional regulator
MANKKTTTKAAAPGRRTRDPQRTSAAILAASVREFTEKGFGGARINGIAKRSGANKRMLYHYFGDKEALYLAVLESAYVGIRSAEAKLHLSDREPVDAIRELALFTWRYYIDHPEFLSILHTENLHRAAHLKRSARIFDLNSPLIAVISRALKKGAESGEFRTDVDAVETYITIAALGFFYLSNRWTLSTVFGRDLTNPRALEAWGEHIVDVVLSFLRAKPSDRKRRPPG